MKGPKRNLMSTGAWPSRSVAIATALVLIPVTWVFLLQTSFRLIFSGSRNELLCLFVLMGFMLLLTAEFSRRISARLLWVRKARPRREAPRSNKMESEVREQRLAQNRQRELLPFCEKRATGDRVLVDAHAFQFGLARRHLQAAPWYRN